MGAAVLNAAKDARHQLSLAVSSKMDTQISDVKLEGGCIVVAGKAMTFRDAARLCFGETAGEILGRGLSQLPIDKNVPLGSPSPFWEIGFGACEVEVDEKTGSVKLLKYISLTDAGKMIHPLQCQGQDEGAAVFGIGQAFFEDLVYDQNGQLLNPNLVDYRLPTFRDVPLNFSTIILEEGGGPGPLMALRGWGKVESWRLHQRFATLFLMLPEYVSRKCRSEGRGWSRRCGVDPAYRWRNSRTMRLLIGHNHTKCETTAKATEVFNGRSPYIFN